MDIQKISGVVGNIQRIVDNQGMTVGYKMNRIKALIGVLQFDLRLLHAENQRQTNPQGSETSN